MDKYKNNELDIKRNPILAGIEYDVAERKPDGKIILNVYYMGKTSKMEVDAKDFEELELIIK